MTNSLMKPVTTLFLDIGGVLLTNGWDRKMRKQAAEVFGIDPTEAEERHHLIFNVYEEGKLTLDDYLSRVFFYQPRAFSMGDFKKFMFAQTKPFPEMIDFVRDLKARYKLKIAMLSNEGRELMTYRIEKFRFTEFVDFFILSSFVQLRKPDLAIYKLALDVAQTPSDQVFYIDDRPLFVEVAASLGIRGICHTGYETTRETIMKLLPSEVTAV